MTSQPTKICTMHKERTGWQGKPAIEIVIRNARSVSAEFCDYLDSIGIECTVDIANRRGKIFTDQDELNAAKAELAKYFPVANAEGYAPYVAPEVL